eukprot:8431495-Pyramimonas_sp.AAC.1
MTQWAAAWKCKCGRQNCNKHVNCTKCGSLWRASDGQVNNSPKDERRQRSQSRKSDTRPWEDEEEEKITAGPPSVRMVTQAEAAAHTDYKTLSTKADEGEKRIYYKKTMSKLNLFQQRYQIAWATKDENDVESRSGKQGSGSPKGDLRDKGGHARQFSGSTRRPQAHQVRDSRNDSVKEASSRSG